MSSSSPLKVISLYSGAGGLDLGIEAAGFETRIAVEIEPDAVSTLRLNRPHWPIIDADIHSEAASSKQILARGGLGVGEADLLIGGPPCQPFSKSGYWARGDARRLEDPRATTLEAYLRVLRDAQPKAFLLENVPGLAYNRKSEGLDLLERTISAINSEIGTRYSFSVRLLKAVEYGVPQFRERVFIIGARDGSEFDFGAMSPTHAEPGEESPNVIQLACMSGAGSRLQPWLTAWDAIGDLDEDDDPSLAMTGKWAELLPSIPEGKNYLHHTERGEGMPLFGWRRRYWSFLLKLAKGLPSWTLAAQPGPATGPFHWRNRRLSVTEMLRLQTFPSGYRIFGSYRSAMRQIGNAVPSALAQRLGLAIRRQLLGEPALDATSLTLLPSRRSDIPEPEPVAKVPKEYLQLRGNHDAHPGTGRGYGAIARTAQAG
jgi:DNA (cytosine-5)-methyltransferase 1